MIFKVFFCFRERVLADFAIIFEGTPEGESEAFVDEDFQSKWGYFGLIYRLTNGEIVNLEAVTKLNVLECFTWLSYETDLGESKRVKQINDTK